MKELNRQVYVSYTRHCFLGLQFPSCLGGDNNTPQQPFQMQFDGNSQLTCMTYLCICAQDTTKEPYPRPQDNNVTDTTREPLCRVCARPQATQTRCE